MLIIIISLLRVVLQWRQQRAVRCGWWGWLRTAVCRSAHSCVRISATAPVRSRPEALGSGLCTHTYIHTHTLRLHGCRLFIMEKHVLMSAALRHVGTVVVLLLLTHTSQELVTSTTVRSLDELSSSYSSIFSPLFKALSEHGGPRWSPALKKKMKPEHRYIKFLSQVYKRSSRVQRSLDGNKTYNTVRLIKPKDECLAQGDKGQEWTHTYTHTYWMMVDIVEDRNLLLKSHTWSLKHYVPGGGGVLWVKWQEPSSLYVNTIFMEGGGLRSWL